MKVSLWWSSKSRGTEKSILLLARLTRVPCSWPGSWCYHIVRRIMIRIMSEEARNVGQWIRGVHSSSGSQPLGHTIGLSCLPSWRPVRWLSPMRSPIDSLKQRDLTNSLKDHVWEVLNGIASDFFLFFSLTFVTWDETHDLTPYLRYHPETHPQPFEFAFTFF